MSALLVLAERCEAAMGPDRNLDYQLDYVRCNWPVIPPAPDEKEWAELAEADDLPRAYTASLDAALTLAESDAYRTGDGLADDHPYSILTSAMVDCPLNGFNEALPRFVCAAALRAIAAVKSPEVVTKIDERRVGL